MASKTVAIIGARLGSSRLPGKQLLPLAGKPLLSHTAARLRAVAAIDEIILATTNTPINQDLLEWAEGEGVVPFAWDGDENDLVGRVDAAFNSSGADRFVYVCGDCALIHPETVASLIDGSIDAGQRGFSCLAPLTNGQRYIHEGFDVYNREFWSEMMAVAIDTFEREHVGAVYHHRGKVTPAKITYVNEASIFSGVDHRLSVDTRRDYLFMRRLYNDWYTSNSSNSLVDLRWVIERLKSEPDLAAMNSHVYQKGADETAPRISILCEAGPTVGLGHLSRACATAGALQDYLGAAVKLFIRGPKTEFSDLALMPHEFVDAFEARHSNAEIVISDLKALSSSDKDLMHVAKQHSKTVAIDMLGDNEGLFDRIWMPSVYVDTVSRRRLGERLSYGLDHFLLRDIYASQAVASKTKRVIILTGGSDPAGLAATLPAKLNRVLPAEIRIDWVTGPFSTKPDFPLAATTRFTEVNAPEDLPSLLTEYDAALCVYGVTFYECLKAQTPVVAFDPIGAAQSAEWKHLSKLLPSFMCDDVDSAVEQLNVLLGQGATVPNQISDMLKEGPQNFASMVSGLLENVGELVEYDHASNT